MTENKQRFRVRQTLNVNDRARTIDFTITGGDTPHIVLQVTENDKRVLSISIDKETIVDLNEGTSYKFVIDIDHSTSETETKLTAEVVDHKGRDFWWFGTPEDALTAYIRQKSVESLVAEFTRDLLNFLSGNISVKTRQE
jgi:hypothetical protein